MASHWVGPTASSVAVSASTETPANGGSTPRTRLKRDEKAKSAARPRIESLPTNARSSIKKSARSSITVLSVGCRNAETGSGSCTMTLRIEITWQGDGHFNTRPFERRDEIQFLADQF